MENLKTYHAYTMAEALAAVKKDLGHDAVILHTRSFRRGGLLGVGRRTVVEVTATPADERGPRRPVVARRDAPRRVAAGRAYSALPPSGVTRTTADRRDEEHRGVGATRASEIGRGRAASRAESLRRPGRELPTRTPEPRVVVPRGVDAIVADPVRTDIEPLTQTVSGSIPTAPPGEADVDRVDRPRQPVAQRFILQPAVQGRPGAADAALEGDAASPPTPLPIVMTEPKGGLDRANGPSMQEELTSIRRMVAQVLDRQRSPAGSPLVDLPAPLMDHYMTLTGQDLSIELAEQVLRRVADELPETALGDEEAVLAAVIERLAEIVPVADEPMPETSPDGRPLTIALVGPTGVGKTTTLAKLAAVFKLRRGRRVGMVTADTYRIAAVDQLRTYANIIGLPLEVALTPADMRQSIHTLSVCDVVLIDTAGRSQNDQRRIDELRAYLDAAEPHEVHLVLSCTASERVLRGEAEAFGAVGVDKVAVTKLDEAVSFGAVVNVLHSIGLSLSFLTTGQEVPDHLEPGSSRRIAELLMGAAVRS